jgi:DNA-binding CsgD family transcriptional regulator/tetratricopeptide (TPR) repeat protein
MLYGRDDERAAIGALLDGARISRSGAVVLRGEAGIGKSALLEDARAHARDMHVLAARGVESEAELPFAALHQLLRPALTHIDALPSPQATALRSALGLAEGAGRERFLVFSACLSLLSEVAEERPVLCLVDDAHWLDSASADALQFVARRLDAEGIVLLFAAREGEARVFEAADIRSVTLKGLNAEAAEALFERTGIDAAPTVRERLLAQTEGNALALVELPTMLTERQLSGEEPLPEVLPMTHQLESVFYERVRRLPDATRLVLLAAAADDSETVGVVYRAAERLGAGAGALDAAEHAGLVTVRRTRLEFRHSLIRSAVYGAATSSERRAAHRALAETLAETGDQDRRAWHLAASTLQPDDDVVRALEEAAERSAERAGHVAAAKALTRAAELSSDPGHRGRCLVRAASNLSLAGRDEHAVTIAKQALEIVDEPELRAQLAHVRELAAVRSGRPHDVVPALLEAARDVAPNNPAVAMQLLVDAADAVWNVGDRDGYLEITRLAGTIPLATGDETSRMYADSLAGFAAMIEGDTASGVRLLGEVAAWGDRTSEPRQVVWASYAAQWLGDEARFGVLIDRAAALARRRGELGILADALGMRAGQRALTQQFEEAAIAATEALQLARELKAANLELYPRAALAIVSAVRGLDEEARSHAAAVLELATANGSRLRASMAVYALALVDLGRARWAEALKGLDSLLEGGSRSLDPFAGHIFPDRIEAAVRASRPEVAEAALPLFEAWAGYAGAPSAQPRLAVSRALLAEGADATAQFEEALALGEQARPFDFARTQLLYGEHLRRVRRRADARVQLRAALEGFDRLRAEPWAERARAELRASGETARRRDPTTVDQLTPQELQIARFVAQGLANKEVASQLFLSPRTIDSHLRNVFAKLGIKSRTQLARLPLGDLDDVGLSGATATSI